VASASEHSHEPRSSIKGDEFLEYLSDYKLLKKSSIPWRVS
jgi:hypothetical protein